MYKDLHENGRMGSSLLGRPVIINKVKKQSESPLLSQNLVGTRGASTTTGTTESPAVAGIQPSKVLDITGKFFSTYRIWGRALPVVIMH
jgi:hypothetical protein